jgi:hypothetical protein
LSHLPENFGAERAMKPFPEPTPLDEELLALLKETCKSYKTFIRDLIPYLAKERENGNIEKWENPVLNHWMIYFLILGYDVGFVSLAILREGLDRQLLTMKRQAFEYAVRGQYYIEHPDKADQQRQALPLKLRQFMEKLTLTDVVAASKELTETFEDAVKHLPPGSGPKYGEVSMFDMVKAIYPDGYGAAYVNGYMIPSGIMHGLQTGMLDAMTDLGEGKMWMSHFSLTTTRDDNVLLITGSLIRLLLMTGDRLHFIGTHWVKLAARFDAILVRLGRSAGVAELPINYEDFHRIAKCKPRNTAPS